MELVSSCIRKDPIHLYTTEYFLQVLLLPQYDFEFLIARAGCDTDIRAAPNSSYRECREVSVSSLLSSHGYLPSRFAVRDAWVESLPVLFWRRGSLLEG